MQFHIQFNSEAARVAAEEAIRLHKWAKFYLWCGKVTRRLKLRKLEQFFINKMLVAGYRMGKCAETAIQHGATV